MGQEESELHSNPRVQVIRASEAGSRPIADERGTLQPISLPDSRSEMDVHVISLKGGGRDGAFHYHSTAENLYYVLEGTLRLRLATGDVEASAGDAVWIPPGLPHGVSVGSTPARLLEVYWPAPADYVVVPEG
jgi:mannose-6-phosphate isomerase-like protein (cupin superfamily)